MLSLVRSPCRPLLFSPPVVAGPGLVVRTLTCRYAFVALDEALIAIAGQHLDLIAQRAYALS